jgi:hypothetical protein
MRFILPALLFLTRPDSKMCDLNAGFADPEVDGGIVLQTWTIL